ncbi:MAG: FkbM family methyltransferase [Rickettsiales bacterium]|nr:FkbM family methyltransferase [Rickettsiales bacterium]
MVIDKTKILSGIASVLGGITLPGTKKIFALPDDLVFVIDTRDNLEKLHNLSSGKGHEPYMIEKMMDFARVNETYIEVGGHYGDFSIRMSRKLGDNGHVYAFEPGRNLFECFSTSVALNGISNIKLENLAVLDSEQEIEFSEDTEVSLMGHVSTVSGSGTQKIKSINLDSYFEGKESSIDVIRLDAEGSECRVLRGAQKIIDSSPDLRLFIEWQSALLDRYEKEEDQRECLSGLVNEGFVLIDIANFDKECGNLNYRFTIDDLIGARVLEFLAIKENSLQKFIDNDVLGDNKEKCSNNLLFAASLRNSPENIKFAISQGADVNKMHSIGATALYMVAQHGGLDVAAESIKAGANVNTKTIGGAPPLCMSAQNNDFPMVKLLVENGADIESSYRNNATALYLATYVNSEDMVKYLLEKGASKNVTVGGFSTFERAIELKHYEIARLLADDELSFCKEISELDIYQEYIEYCGQIENFNHGENF